MTAPSDQYRYPRPSVLVAAFEHLQQSSVSIPWQPSHPRKQYVYPKRSRSKMFKPHELSSATDQDFDETDDFTESELSTFELKSTKTKLTGTERCFVWKTAGEQRHSSSTLCTTIPNSPSVLNERLQAGQIVLGVRIPMSLAGGNYVIRPPTSQTLHSTLPTSETIEKSLENASNTSSLLSESCAQQYSASLPTDESAGKVDRVDKWDATTGCDSSPDKRSAEQHPEKHEDSPTMTWINLSGGGCLAVRNHFETEPNVEGQLTAHRDTRSCNSSDCKLSPSARFPGWGVITDDEDESTVSSKEKEQRLISLDNQSVVDRKSQNPIIIKVVASSSEHEEDDHESQIETHSGDHCCTALPNQPHNVHPDDTEFQSPNSSIPSANERRGAQNTPVRQIKPLTSILQQPRKSLATIISHLSNNLRLNSTSVNPAAISPLCSNQSADNKETENASHSVRSSIIDLTGSKLLKNKRGNSTLIQLGKDRSTGAIFPSTNGDVECTKDSSGRHFGIHGPLGDKRMSKANDVFPSSGPSTSRATCMNPTDVPGERSLMMDLFCCARCTQLNDRHYSSVIENHKLARLITLGAILAIVGLILAYIIRSALEAPNFANGMTASNDDYPV